MKTTVELSDELFRRAKAAAALRGRRLKDMIEEGLRLVLETPSGERARPSLEKLMKEARGVVGAVAKRNFEHVRDRLMNIVLRADVGITEEAWEVREEQRTRVRNLQVEPAREDVQHDHGPDEHGDADADAATPGRRRRIHRGASSRTRGQERRAVSRSVRRSVGYVCNSRNGTVLAR